jgi:hypothetical protein
MEKQDGHNGPEFAGRATALRTWIAGTGIQVDRVLEAYSSLAAIDSIKDTS